LAAPSLIPTLLSRSVHKLGPENVVTPPAYRFEVFSAEVTFDPYRVA